MNMRTILCLLALSLPSSGLAWVSGDESVRGPLRADIPHDPTELNNEHGLLWQQSMEFAGLPLTLIGEFQLDYWTDTVGFPAPLTNAEISTTRPYALDGMSALPDHSFSLWDWAAGNLTCPIGGPGGSAEACHSAVGHMGPMGSRHYPSQARSNYAYYHGLAMDRARQCATLADALDAADSDIDNGLNPDGFVEECEREALLLEAFGQHFLQDAWAIGHMWERWGSADIRDFDERDLAEAVALGAALIHGAESILGAEDDLSSAVSGDVTFSLNGTVSAGAGDLHLSEFSSDARYEAQRTGLYQCAAAGLRAVYAETRMTSGSMNGYSGPGVPASEAELLGDACFGQRATDEAMLAAIGLTGNDLVGDVLLVGASTLVRSTGVEREDLTDGFRLELLRLLSLSWLNGLEDDLPATGLASGGDAFASFMGVGSNTEFDALAPYVDPEITSEWPLPAGEGDAARGNGFDARPSRVLARVFNRSHLTGWCDDVEASPSLLRDAFLADSSPAKLSLCESFTARHIRPQGGQSLCEAVGLGGFTIPAQAGQSAAEAANLYCDPPPPLEITAETIEPNPWVASVSVDLPGPGGSDTDTDGSLPVDVSADEDDDDHVIESEIESDVQISISGPSATVSGSIDARFFLDRLQLSSGIGGEASGSIEWSVSITVSTRADYRLSVNTSGAYTGSPFVDCSGAIGVLLSENQPGDLQAVYGDGCGDSYPQSVSEEIEGTLEAGTYLLTVTSDTPLASDWLLDGSFGDPELQIDSTFELRIVEEGADF